MNQEKANDLIKAIARLKLISERKFPVNPAELLDEVVLMARKIVNEDRKVWSTGHNVPGYLPEEEPDNFEDWNTARSQLISDLERAARDNADAALDKGYTTALNYVQALYDGMRVCIRIGNYVWWLEEIELPPTAGLTR